MEILRHQNASRAAKLVIGKIYEGELGEDRLRELESFVKRTFGKSSNENNLIAGVIDALHDADSKYEY
jgi:hypothetical protein